MEITRFSEHGFEPQYQSFHLKHIIEPMLKLYRTRNYEDIPQVGIEYFKKFAKFVYENLDDFKYGIWVFVNNHIEYSSLSHLKSKISVWKADICDFIYVYDVNLDEKYKITDKRARFFGCYIPQKELKYITNIHKVR